MPVINLMAIMGCMAKECSDLGHMWDFEAGRPDESQPICYNSGVKSLDLFETVYLCGRGNPVKLDSIEYCAACEFFPEKHKQKALFS